MSDLFSAVLGYFGTQDTNQTQMAIANEANAFSAQQYASRYQTQVKDMEAAGLNPMLSYMQSPGSAPVGQQAQVQNPMASAISAYHQSKERDVMSTQIEKMHQEVVKSKEEVQQVRADTALKVAQALEADTRAKLNTAQASAAEEHGRLSSSQTLKNLIDSVRQGPKTQSEIEKNIQDVSFSKLSGNTQIALARKYISEIPLNEAGVKSLLSLATRNTIEGKLADARIKEAVARGEIAFADIQRAKNAEAFELSNTGKASRFIEFYGNTAQKAKNLLPSKSVTVRESPWGNSRSTTSSR